MGTEKHGRVNLIWLRFSWDRREFQNSVENRCQHWFPSEVMFEERMQKFHSDDVSQPRSNVTSRGSQCWHRKMLAVFSG